VDGDARHSVFYTLCSAVAGLAGCEYSFDRDVDAGDAVDLRCATWAATHVDLCAMPAPMPALELPIAGRWTFDTSTLTLHAPDGGTIETSAALVEAGAYVGLSVRSLVIPNGVELRVVGSVPLVVASWSDIAIDGVVDVASYAGDLGASANAACSTSGARDGTVLSVTGGGGGGGGLGTGGASGGNARESAKSIGGGGGGGSSNTSPHRVRGGCPGGRGGLMSEPPGDGGGAVH
jgi:hypothetical protein